MIIILSFYTLADHNSTKKTLGLTLFFVLLGSACIKAVRKILMKLTLEPFLIILYHCFIFKNYKISQIPNFGSNPIKLVFKKDLTSLKLLDRPVLQLRDQTISYDLNWVSAPARNLRLIQYFSIQIYFRIGSCICKLKPKFKSGLLKNYII